MICPKCGEKHHRQHRYCKGCHAANMREWRKANPITDEQRARGIARSHANVYLKRGKIKKTPCVSCGSKKVQMRHEDYAKPLNVKFMCHECHKADRKAKRMARFDAAFPALAAVCVKRAV